MTDGLQNFLGIVCNSEVQLICKTRLPCAECGFNKSRFYQEFKLATVQTVFSCIEITVIPNCLSLQAGESVMSADCTKKCTCFPKGVVICESISCATGERCLVLDGVQTCQQDSKYKSTHLIFKDATLYPSAHGYHHTLPIPVPTRPDLALLHEISESTVPCCKNNQC